jgi:hypothetical protein
MSAREVVEQILCRRLRDREIEPLHDLDNIGKLLAIILADNGKPPWVRGFDAAAALNWLGLRTVGSCVTMYDVDWICIVNIYQAMEPIAGKQIGRLFISVGPNNHQRLTWIPSGIMILDQVQAACVKLNAARIEQVAEKAFALSALMQTELVAEKHAKLREARLLEYRAELQQLCRTSKESP